MNMLEFEEIYRELYLKYLLSMDLETFQIERDNIMSTKTLTIEKEIMLEAMVIKIKEREK